jgi:hypothetical protein
MSRLGGVALTSQSLHTERISQYKLNYPPFQMLVPVKNLEGDVSVAIPE